jgi:hypothetical protein
MLLEGCSSGLGAVQVVITNLYREFLACVDLALVPMCGNYTGAFCACVYFTLAVPFSSACYVLMWVKVDPTGQ